MESVVGIDIGGTKTKIGLVDKNGRALKKSTFRTKEHPELKDYMQQIKLEIETLKEKVGSEVEVKGIGAGAPNANYYTGNIEFAPNLLWKGVIPLADELKKLYDLPVAVTNDANAAAMGEAIYGNAREMKNFIVITLGTGLGSGIIVEGNLVNGFDGFAGELGHITVKEGGRMCGTGRRGCLEAYVSSTGLKRTIMYLLSDSMTDSVFRNIAFNDLHGEDITKAAEEGDPIATRAYELTGEVLGKALANFVAFSQPEAIFLLGGLANAGKWIFEPTMQHMEENLMEIYKGKVKLLPSGMPEKDAAILGAAALIWQEIGELNAVPG